MGMSLFDKARVEVLQLNITTVDKKDVDLRHNFFLRKEERTHE